MDQPFSLILGGGSARGIAHIGVIRGLEELSVEPELVVGTSMGALIGAFYACGYTSQEMQEIAEKIGVFRILDLNWTAAGIPGKNIVKFLNTYLEGQTFGTTNIPLKIVATDMYTGEKVVFSTGSLVDAVRASIALPGIIQPHELDGRHLIDGGMVSNLPVELAPSRDKIIAVSVKNDLGHKRAKKKRNFFSFNTFFEAYTVITNALDIMIGANERHSLESRRDVYLIQIGRPDIEYYDIEEAGALISEGYRAGSGIREYLTRKRPIFQWIRHFLQQ